MEACARMDNSKVVRIKHAVLESQWRYSVDAQISVYSPVWSEDLNLGATAWR